MNALKQTLKAFPMVTAVTIGLCYLTQLVAGWFGVELPDQENLELVRRYMGWNWNFAFLCAQVLVLMPVIEELIFRLVLYRLPGRFLPLVPDFLRASVSSALFSAAHYIVQPFPDSAFLALYFFGISQCWLYRKTDRLWCAMLNHGLFNLTNLVLLFLIPQS